MDSFTRITISFRSLFITPQQHSYTPSFFLEAIYCKICSSTAKSRLFCSFFGSVAFSLSSENSWSYGWRIGKNRTRGLFWDNTRVSDFVSWCLFPTSTERCTSRAITNTPEWEYLLESALLVCFHSSPNFLFISHTHTASCCGVSNVKRSFDSDMDFINDSRPRLADSMFCCTAYSFPAEVQNSLIWELIS